MSRAIVERMHEEIAPWMPAGLGRMVELGAGDGSFLERLAARRPERLYAVDHRVSTRRIDGVRYVRADFGRLPFRGGVFDGLSLVWTFPGEPPGSGLRALREIGRVAAPGARLVLTLTNFRNPLLWLRALVRRIRRRGWPRLAYREEWVLGRLARAGFTVRHRGDWAEEPRAWRFPPRAWISRIYWRHVSSRPGWRPIRGYLLGRVEDGTDV